MKQDHQSNNASNSITPGHLQRALSASSMSNESNVHTAFLSLCQMSTHLQADMWVTVIGYTLKNIAGDTSTINHFLPHSQAVMSTEQVIKIPASTLRYQPTYH